MASGDTGKLAEWYDAISSGYDELYGEEQSRKHQMVLELLRGRRFGPVVDVGCGTGALLKRIKADYPCAVGVDLSLGMLKKAKRTVGTHDLDLVRADCSSLPIRDKVADCVLSVSMADADSAFGDQLLEMRRIAKVTGTLALSVLHSEGETLPTKSFSRVSVEHCATLSGRETLYLLRKSF